MLIISTNFIIGVSDMLIISTHFIIGVSDTLVIYPHAIYFRTTALLLCVKA